MTNNGICFASSPEPYFDHKNDTAFEAGLKLLAAEPFDPVNLTNRQIYYDFIDAFGTHIVTDGKFSSPLFCDCTACLETHFLSISSCLLQLSSARNTSTLL